MNSNSIEFTMNEGRSRHGGLNESIHNTSSKPAGRPVAVQVPLYNSIHGPTYRLSHGRNVGDANSAEVNPANGFSGGPLNAHAIVPATGHHHGNTSHRTINSHVASKSGYHDGLNNLPRSFHRGPSNEARRHNHEQQQDQATPNIDARTHTIQDPTVSNHHQQGPETSLSVAPMPMPVENPAVGNHVVHNNPVANNPIDNNSDETNDSFYDQFECLVRDSKKIIPMTAAYSLEKDYRDELWDALQMKMRKYHGYESWAIPFPAGMSFGKLVIDHCNETYEIVDSRLIRVMFRDHVDKDGKKLAKDILLTPSNPSIDLADVRLHSALMDGYWKLSRWLAGLMSGNEVNLYLFLRSELQKELKEKKERTM